MEREPAVTSFISGVVAALVRAAGLDPVIDEMGNLTAQIGTGQPPRRFLLTYAMTHAAARGILAQLPRDIGEAVVAVGTDGDVWAGNKGRIDMTVTIRGKASHSSS